MSSMPFMSMIVFLLAKVALQVVLCDVAYPYVESRCVIFWWGHGTCYCCVDHVFFDVFAGRLCGYVC